MICSDLSLAKIHTCVVYLLVAADFCTSSEEIVFHNDMSHCKLHYVGFSLSAQPSHTKLQKGLIEIIQFSYYTVILIKSC